MSKFKRDLRQGKLYEEKALTFFNYKEYEFSKGYFKEYDILLDGKTKIEVKSDRLASKTGNICIEYKYKNKPSGINATTADYWVYFVLHPKDNIIKNKIVKEDIYIFPTDKLKELLVNAKKVRGGDGYNSKMYLIKTSLCNDYLFTGDKYELEKIELLENMVKSFKL